MMKTLYNVQYSKRLDGLVARVGGHVELIFLQRMRRSRYFRDAQAVIDQYGHEKRLNAVVSFTFESGKVVEQAVYAPRFLEIGCNTGYFLKKAAHPTNFGWGIYGVDINAAAINKMVNDSEKDARNQPAYATKTAATVAVMDAQALQFENATFRIVTARHVLEHLPDPAKGIEELVRVTEHGGIIALSYPYEPVRGLAAVLSAISTTGNPFDARKLHLHKLTPRKVARLFDPHYIFGDKSMLILAPYPIWVHVLLRNAMPYDAKNYTPFSKLKSLV